MRNPDGTERIRTIIPGQVGTGKCMAPRAFVSTDPLSLAANFLFAREIGIGAAVTHRPLPHHRAYGSVHGGSIGYANSPRLMTEDRGTGSRHSTEFPTTLQVTGPILAL